MKLLSLLVVLSFLFGSIWIPSSKASGTPVTPEFVKTFADDHPLNTKLQAQAKLAYTISYYQDYVFSHESGWRTDAVNASSGACGLGQAWPCSKLPCPLTKDGFDCQMSWFNNYAQQRFGGWEGAYNYWVAHHNW